MKKSLILFGIIGLIGIISMKLQSCASPQAIQAKPGALLWGENCVRCHNTPSPADYSDHEWDLVTMHMRVRANLTEEESEKILEFLQMAN